MGLGVSAGGSARGVGGRDEVLGEGGLVHHDDVAFAAVVLGHDVDEVVVEGLLVRKVGVAAVAVDLRVCRINMEIEHGLIGEVDGADAAAVPEEPFQPGRGLREYRQRVLPPGLGGSVRRERS